MHEIEDWGLLAGLPMFACSRRNDILMTEYRIPCEATIKPLEGGIFQSMHLLSGARAHQTGTF